MINMLPQTLFYCGRIKDSEQLKASSSGGAFTAISDVFLNRHDAVVCSTYNFESDQQEYLIIESTAERDKARGSKYMQSIPGDIFHVAEAWLKEHPANDLLFVGVGCQAAGFLRYAENKGLRDRVTVVDIICHGSPSPKIWREYAGVLKGSSDRLDTLTFKDKRHGWNNPTAAVTVDGRETLLQAYVRTFYKHVMLRPACHKCPYSTAERQADITIGDFWHIEEKIPSFYDKMGTSLFIVHTERGSEVFDAIKDSIDWIETNATDCWQINLERPTERSLRRDEFWRDYKSKGVAYIIEKYGYESKVIQMKRSIKKTLKNIRGGVLEGPNFAIAADEMFYIRRVAA